MVFSESREERISLNKSKLNKYDLTASIHTVEIHSSYPPFLENVKKNVARVRFEPSKKTGKLVSHVVVNPHNFGDGEVLTFSEYEDVMSALTKKIKLRKYKYDRLDIRLDSYEDNYHEYFKLNALLVGLFSMVYKFKNDEPVISLGQQTRLNHSVYVKNQLMGIEYYNKKKQSDNKYPCKARLEFRAFKLNGKCPIAVVKQWFKRCDRLENYFSQFLDKCNDSLLCHYEKWQAENQMQKSESVMLRYFVRENQDIIFTKTQLEEFLQLCGVYSPESRAKNIRKSCEIEMISWQDIRDYIAKIKESITHYMEM